MNQYTSILSKLQHTHYLYFNVYTHFIDIFIFLMKKNLVNLRVISSFFSKSTNKPLNHINWKAEFTDKNFVNNLSFGSENWNKEPTFRIDDNLFNVRIARRVYNNTKSKKNQHFFFFLNFLFFYSNFKSRYSMHQQLSFFYSQEFKKDLIVVNSRQFYERWKDARDFIFNIYYYNFTPILFGSFEFQNEILALNWNNINMEYNYWKYTFSFFTRAVNNYGVRTKHFFKKIENLNVDFFLITNANYQYKNIYYFNKFKFFTIGPVTSNLSPWLLTYSLPVFSVNPLSEYFFIKLIILLEKKTMFYKFYLKKFQWTSFFIKKI